MSWPEVWDYIILSIEKLYQGVPNIMFVFLILITIVGMLLVIFYKGVKQKWKVIGAMLLAEYLLLTYCTTVFLRPLHDTQELRLKLFWSYSAFFEGKNYVMAEKIMNLVVFMPVGVLSTIAFGNIKWYYVLLMAILFSVSIEMLQFLLNRGCAELDDVIHNTVGVLLGYGVFLIVKKICVVFSKKSVTVL